MKYVIKFSKKGVICYTSHLDIMKVFQRSFKRAGIKLAYSHGFNPHPKMGFAQPLSLGYEGLAEYIEFETDSDFDAMGLSKDEILEKLAALMPLGLDLISISCPVNIKKTLAADTDAAEYTVKIPVKSGELTLNREQMLDKYMGQDQIITLKKQKVKSKKRGKNVKKETVLVETDIKPRIRDIKFYPAENELTIEMLLDSGSVSNLSPELVISTVIETFGISTDRSEVSVIRRRIIFKNYDTGH